MTTSTHKGRIKNVRQSSSGGFSYDREAPGVNFPTDFMTKEEIDKLSSPVKTYKYDELKERE